MMISSSDSGMINFWNVFKGHLLGSFHAAFADQGNQVTHCPTPPSLYPP